MPQSDSTRPDPRREAIEGLRKLATAFGMMVETAFPRDEPKETPDDGEVHTVSYPESAKLVVSEDSAGNIVSVRYGGVELPFTLIQKDNVTPTGARLPIVSMRLRRRPS
jgi:hypothetical protein